MSSFLHDARHALRLFAARPGMTAIAVLSLALATGPNAALFSVVDTLFLQDLGLYASKELVGIQATTGRGFSYLDYADIAAQAKSFSHTVAWERRGAAVSVNGYEQITPMNVVAASYFAGLGVAPVLGRVLAPEIDEAPQPEAPVVVSYSFWQRRFGGCADVVGQVFQINARNAVVVGVAPAWFRGLDVQMPVDIWLPFSASDALRIGRKGYDTREGGPFDFVVARLRPGVSVQQARAELGAIAQHLSEAYPGTNKDRTFSAFPLMRRKARQVLAVGGIALGLVSLVLLVACANVAGLLLALAAERKREVAVRLSLGAGRWRLLRQFLTESLVLAVMGATGGLLLGYWLLKIPLKPPVPASVDFGVTMNASVFAYALAISLFAALAFGLLPALKASKHDLVGALKSREGEPPRGRRWLSARNVLVVSQIVIAQFLLAGTALWVRSYTNISTAHTGFDQSRKVLFAQLALSGAGAPSEPGAMQDVLERLRALPGVLEVSGSMSIPLSGSGGGATQKVLLPGDSGETAVHHNAVAPRYFALMGYHLLRGRDFDSRDGVAAKALIVNEAMARRIAPRGEAVGRWLRVEGVEREVIGVVENGKYGQLREPEQPYLYLPAPAPPILAVRVADYSPVLAEAVRRTVSQAAPQLRVVDLSTLRQHMAFATYVDKAAVALFAVLGFVGIVLAAVGLYGVVAQSVTRRTHEIGIRLALGAEPRSVVRMILGDGFKLALVGVPLGLALAGAGAIVASSMLFGVTPYDPLSYVAGAVAVSGVALLASHFPARRATRVQPSDALRAE